MKKVLFVVLSILLTGVLVSCSKHEEETKMISSSEVSFSGHDKKMLKIAADSVKIMLVNTNKENDEWEVRAIISLQNTMAWSEFPMSEKNAGKRASHYFEPSMGNIDITYLDPNGSDIELSLSPDWDKLKSILSSDEIVTEDVLIKHRLWSKSYENAKDIFDKVTKLSLSNMELSKVTVVQHSSSSSSYDAYEEAYDKAMNEYEKAYDKAMDEYEKAMDQASSFGF